jgi:Fur family ferric uptake transcriptional regulator
MLRQKNIHANKTTVYRQLDVLEQANMIQLVTLADRIQRYELVGESHHHHLVCLHCHKIEDVDFPTDLEQQEQLIAQTNNFKVSYHSLEFFGVCGKCQEGM